MADLWERLRAAREKPITVDSESAGHGAEPAPDGWNWVTPLVAERTLEFPLSEEFWRALEPVLNPEAWRGVLCFDTETTGLSGAAGTVAFLIGWAELVPDDALPLVRIRQVFLRDLPGEHDALKLVDQRFREAAGLVSFNGASFDLPLLRSRFALASLEFPSLPHRDDLHPARRLWKRLLESCRLSRLEETVLGLNRVDDVSGHLVPALWYQYLNDAAPADFQTPLEGVLRHHAQDVYSLLCLDLVLHALRASPDNPRWRETFGPFPHRVNKPLNAGHGLLHPDFGVGTPVDFWGLLELRPEESQLGALERAWSERGTEVLGMAWAHKLKRRRDDRAKAVWTKLWEERKSYLALEELLKWLEHRERTPEALAEALALIEVGLRTPFWPEAWKQELRRRQGRMEG